MLESDDSNLSLFVFLIMSIKLSNIVTKSSVLTRELIVKRNSDLIKPMRSLRKVLQIWALNCNKKVLRLTVFNRFISLPIAWKNSLFHRFHRKLNVLRKCLLRHFFYKLYNSMKKKHFKLQNSFVWNLLFYRKWSLFILL